MFRHLPSRTIIPQFPCGRTRVRTNPSPVVKDRCAQRREILLQRGTVLHDAKLREPLRVRGVLRGSQRFERLAVGAAVEADEFHHRLAVAPVVRFDHELHDLIRLVLPFRRGLEVTLRGELPDVREVLRDDVVGRPDAAGEDIAEGKSAEKLFVTAREPDRLLVETALETLRGVVVAPLSITSPKGTTY